MKLKIIILAVLLCSQVVGQIATPQVVSINDLMEAEDDVFKEVPAKIIFRNIYFEFGRVLEVHERVKIYNKEGLEYSNWEIPFDNVKSLKASTYNLENGQLVKTDVAEDAIIKDQIDEDYEVNKIIFPNVQVGSVIEVSYKINYVGMQNIYCQSTIPIKKFKLVLRNPNYVSLNVAENGSSNVKLSVVETPKQIMYTGENIPGLTYEKYLGGINNYRGRLFFEIPGLYGKNKLNRWSQVYDYYNNGRLGFENLIGFRKVYKNDLELAVNGAANELDKAKKVYFFVQKRMNWNQYYSRAEERLANAYKEKEASVSGINLILVAMLREAGIEAYPMLIASKSRGFIKFPTISGFNNTIACARIAGKNYLLDASREFGNFGEIPLSYVNGDGLVLYEDDQFELFSTRTTKKSKNTISVMAEINPNDLSLQGEVKQRVSGYFAWEFRTEYEGDYQSKYEEFLETEHNFLKVDSLVTKDFDDVSKPVGLFYDFKLGEYLEEIDGKLYFEPFVFFGKKENEFKDETRLYPIDFLHPYSRNLTIKFSVPEGYKVESLPESKQVGVSNNVASFSVQCKEATSEINITLSLQVHHSIVSAKYYEEIKALFSSFIESSKTQIVLYKV